MGGQAILRPTIRVFLAACCGLWWMTTMSATIAESRRESDDIEQRVGTLLEQMTLVEKIGQMMGRDLTYHFSFHPFRLKFPGGIEIILHAMAGEGSCDSGNNGQNGKEVVDFHRAGLCCSFSNSFLHPAGKPECRQGHQDNDKG